MKSTVWRLPLKAGLLQAEVVFINIISGTVFMFEDINDMGLLAMVQHDNEVALSELVRRYWDKLFVIAVHTISPVHQQEAEEAVSDVFIRVWKNRKTLVISRSVSHYLAVAIKYEAISRLRNQHRRQRLFETNAVQPEEYQDTVTDQLRERELFEELERTINELPQKCSIIFKMSRQRGLSTAEIAEELNISPNTVDAQIGKALKKMRARLRAPIKLTT